MHLRSQSLTWEEGELWYLWECLLEKGADAKALCAPEPRVMQWNSLSSLVDGLSSWWTVILYPEIFGDLKIGGQLPGITKMEKYLSWNLSVGHALGNGSSRSIHSPTSVSQKGWVLAVLSRSILSSSRSSSGSVTKTALSLFLPASALKYVIQEQTLPSSPSLKLGFFRAGCRKFGGCSYCLTAKGLCVCFASHRDSKGIRERAGSLRYSFGPNALRFVSRVLRKSMWLVQSRGRC